jgi:hypothetical protein
MNDEFYVGYLDPCPPRLARFIGMTVATVALLSVGLGVLIAARQTPAIPGTFEFGIARDFAGTILERPLPLLRTLSTNGSVTNYLLVGFGKHGLPAFARGQHGQHVRFKGSLIQKDGSVMIELNDERSFAVLAADPLSQPPAPETIGPVTLTGELVDTKCYLGVMRPAVGKVHRACAIRCLSGGVPPGLLVQRPDGSSEVVLLAGPNQAPLQFDVQWAARRVVAEGILERHEGNTVPITTQLKLLTP